MSEQFDVQAPSNVKGLLTGKAISMQEAIRNRSTERFRVQGGSVYSDTNRTIQFRLTSSQYADMTTACLHYNLVKDSPLQLTEDLTVLSSIESARITIAGKEVERINQCRALKPIVYTSCSKEYYDTTLSMAGAWKYKPSYMGVVATKLSDQDHYGATSGQPLFTGTAYLAPMLPSTAAGAGTSNAVLTAATTDTSALSLASANLMVNDPTVLRTLLNEDLGLAASSHIGFGTNNGFMRAPINRELTSFASVDMCPSNQGGSNVLGGCVLPSSLDTWTTTSGDAVNEKGGLITASRDYSMPLSLIFGLCRTHDTLVPLRNLGSVEVELTLAPYAQWFLHNLDIFGERQGIDTSIQTTASSGTENAKVTASGYNTYSIVNPTITMDIVQCSDAIVRRVDEMCASSEGFAMSIESYSTVTTPFDYSESVSINYLQGFSSLRDIYVSFRPAKGLNAYYPKSDTYLGSRFLEADVMVGSTQFPTQSIQGPTQAWTELMKSYSHLDHRKGGGVVDYRTYIGERATPAPHAPASAGLMPSLQASVNSVKAYGQCQVKNIPTQKPSCFLLGQSFEKVLHHSKTFSGISSRASGLGLTHNFKFRQFDATKDPSTDSTSLMNPRYLDAHLGAGYDMLADTVLHHDVLITIANDSVSVAT